MEVTKNKDINMDDFLLLTPNMLAVWSHVVLYCSENDLRLCITSLITDRTGDIDRPPHSDGRGIDISIKEWSLEDIEWFVSYFNKELEGIAAISAKTFRPVLALHHRNHIHLQVKPI